VKAAVGDRRTDPRWRRDGRELFYVASDNKLMAVPIQVTPDTSTPTPGGPVALFPTLFARGANVNIGWMSRQQYAVTADGRFLINVAADEPATSPMTIVHNWTVGLKQ
jgi:eukaryotic-like serine/threonine-protein kinase